MRVRGIEVVNKFPGQEKATKNCTKQTTSAAHLGCYDHLSLDSELIFFRSSINKCYSRDKYCKQKYVTNRFHVAVRLFSNRSQMT